MLRVLVATHITTAIFNVIAHFVIRICFFLILWRCDPTPAMASSFLRFLDHTQRRTTVGRTPPDE